MTLLRFMVSPRPRLAQRADLAKARRSSRIARAAQGLPVIRVCRQG
ncbi:MAG: hypothetical protein ACOVQL_10665 [Limnohabitans sp.]